MIDTKIIGDCHLVWQAVALQAVGVLPKHFGGLDFHIDQTECHNCTVVFSVVGCEG